MCFIGDILCVLSFSCNSYITSWLHVIVLFLKMFFIIHNSITILLQFYVVTKLRLAFSLVSLTFWLLIRFFWWWLHFEWVVIIWFNWNESYLHCQLEESKWTLKNVEQIMLWLWVLFIRLLNCPYTCDMMFISVFGFVATLDCWTRRAPGFLKLLLSANFCMRVCVCVRPRGYQ